MKSNRKKWRRIAPVIGIAFWLFVSATVVLAQGRAVQRPIEEFVEAQGTFCFPDGAGGCLIFVPPIENFLGWVSPDYCASVDYAGLANAEWGELFGTTTRGSVTERPLADGRAEVNVRLHTSNALTWVIGSECDFANSPVLFGQRTPEGSEWANAALGESLLQVKFINTAPGDPLPDLIQLWALPLDGQELQSIKFTARADGPLREAYGVPDGTPGRTKVIQIGLFTTNWMGATADGFPAERINLMVVGH
jgi:hypothetical protein